MYMCTYTGGYLHSLLELHSLSLLYHFFSLPYCTSNLMLLLNILIHLTSHASPHYPLLLTTHASDRLVSKKFCWSTLQSTIVLPLNSQPPHLPTAILNPYRPVSCFLKCIRTCVSVTQVAEISKSKAIIAFTTSGSTALRVSKLRPTVPIIAVTYSMETARWLAMVSTRTHAFLSRTCEYINLTTIILTFLFSSTLTFFLTSLSH